MAGGNLGDLWFQLGIRQNVSQQLDKVLSSLGLTDREANKLLHTLQGLGNKELGISKQSAKNAGTFADVLNKINKKYVELSKNEDTKDGAKVLLDRTKNALNYLAALQRIAGAQHSLENLKSLNPNVDTSKLKEASGWLEALKKQMLNLQSYGGVDNAKVIGFYSQAVSATLRDVAKVTSSFKKENPLSVLSGNTAKVETDLSRVTEKFAKLNDLMAEGARKGYNTSMLTSSFAELNSVLARLQSAQGNNSLLSDAAQMKNLFSDVQVAVNKAGDAMSAYGREKGKVIAAEREHQTALDKAKKEANEKAAADRKLTLGLAEMEAWLKRIDALGMKGLNLGADVSKMDEIRAKVQALADTFLGFTGTGINLLGKGGRDGIEELINKLKVLRTEYSEARQAQRELNSEQSKANSKANSEQKRQEAEARRDNARAAREEAADEKAVASAIESARKRYQELSEVIRQLKAERKTASNLGLDTTQLDAAIGRAMSGVRSLRELLQNLQNSKSFDLVVRASFGNGSDIAGATNNAIRGYKELNNEKRHANELEQKHRQEVIATAAKVRNDLAAAFRQANQHAGQMNGTLQDLKNLFLQGGLVYGAQQFVMSIIQTGGEMEKQHIALQSILGDIQNANTMFGQIKQLALESPFTFSELNKDVKQLAAYGVEYEDLYDTTKRLADMSSGLGVSFERIALAFGQVQARGWLDGKELRQIAYAGIPLLSKLSEMYSKREGKTVTTSEIKKRISNREVSFDDVKSIFWEMTDAGGQFYNMQQVLSETLLGRYNKLKDAWEIMLSEFASGKSIVGGTFSFIIDRITDLVLAANKLGGTFAALFSSFALLKGMKMLGGGAGAAFLASKGQAANAAMGKLAQGQALTSVERQILATKNQITNADLRSLIASKSITKVELQRLLVSGKISAKQYQIYSALLKQQGATDVLSAKTVTYGLSWTRVGVAAKLAIGGIATAAKGLWAAIGGLPGLILTGIVSAVTYLIGESSELSDAISRTNEELQDRQKTINTFRVENNVSKIISNGDIKEIDNAINAYKEKLKELSPQEYNIFVMKADEQSSHEKRLEYLDKQLKLLQEANKVAQEKLLDRGKYSDLKDDFEDAKGALEKYAKAYSNLQTWKPDVTDSDRNNFRNEEHLKRQVRYKEQTLLFEAKNIAKDLTEIYGNISSDPKLTEAAKQTIDSFIGAMEIGEDQANMLRLHIYNALGIGNNVLRDMVAQKTVGMIDEVVPEIANRIRAKKDLDDASKGKVKELMQSAVSELSRAYPQFSNQLQQLLNDSNFTATINLVYSMTGSFDDFQTTLYDRAMGGNGGSKNTRNNNGVSLLLADQPQNNGLNLPSLFGGNGGSKNTNRNASYQGATQQDKDFQAIMKIVGKATNDYEMANAFQKAYDDAFNKYTATKENKKATKAEIAAAKKEKDEITRLAALEGVTLKDTYSKNNSQYKPDKNKNKTREEDKELKLWKERLSSAKAFYQMYEKYKDVLGPDAALKETKNMFPDVADMDVHDYEGSLRNMLSKLGDGWFSKSPERKKFKTDIEKAIKEWHLEEVVKVEAEQAAAAFTEALEQAISQWDLYKSLFEKTGSKDFASQAFKDGAVWSDLTKGLAAEFKAMTGEDVDIYATDEGAKKHLENNKPAYELWKKIVGLVKNEYTKTLNEAADAMARQATIAEKIAAINEKYDRIVGFANEQNDGNTSETIRRANKSRHDEIQDAIYGQFPDLKPLAEQIYDISEKYTELLRYAEEVGDTRLAERAGQARNGEVLTKEYESYNAYTGFEAMINNAENLTSAMLNRLQREVVAWLKNPNLTPEMRDKLTGFQTQLGSVSANNGNIFSGYRDLQQGLAIRQLLDGGLTGLQSRTDNNGNRLYTMNAAWAKRTGLTEGGEYTLEQLQNDGTKKEGSFAASLSSLSTKFKALQDCLSPVIDLFDALGMEDTALGEAMSIGSNAIGAASSVAGGLNALGLESAGPYGAAAAAALSVATSIAQLHDKALQKEIEASQERQKEMENIYSNVKDLLENTLGGVYSFNMSDSIRETLQTISSQYSLFDNIEKTETGYKKLLAQMFKANNGYSEKTIAAIDKALSTNSGGQSNAYNAQYASLLVQKEELEKQYNAEAKKKKSDSSALLEYKQQIYEAEQAVENFTKEFLNSEYGVSIENWASELTNAIVDAWASGEDAAESYKDKVKDILKELTISIASQKYMEQLLKPIETYFSDTLQTKDKLDEGDIKHVGDMLMEASEKGVEDITSILDYMKEAGWDMSENGSSSISKSIKSITEETADLLASYVNAIRLDCSVIRTNVQAILESVKILPNLNVIAQSQLTQLNQLVSLASSRNDKLDTMYDWMQKVTNGTKKLYIA